MEEMISQLAINLKRLRVIKGFTQDELAKSAGISRNAYRSIEKGSSEPRFNNLQRLADALDEKVFSLLKAPPQVSSLRFRSRKTMTVRDKNKRQQHIYDFSRWLADFNFLETELGEGQGFQLSKLVMSTADPVEMAKQVRLSLKLDDHEPIYDICDLVESAGIKIFQLDSELKSFFGFCLSENDGGPAIGVNESEQVSVERKIFTVAHELGHILMHPGSFHDQDVQEDEREESEADRFAGHFLMPQAGFERELNKSRGLHWIKLILHVKRVFKVSYKTVILRLIEMGIVSSADVWMRFAIDYKKLYGGSLKNHYEPNSLPQSEFGLPEPKGLDSFDFVESKLHLLVRKAVEQELITTQRAAEVLNISLREMRELTLAWSGVQ